jgi:hypothetical protein
MRREILTLSIAAGVVLASFGATVLILNSTLYSASGYVRGYLDALGRSDVDGALELAETAALPNGSDELLARAAIADLSDIRLVGEVVDPDGVHRVSFAYLADGIAGQTEFAVEAAPATLGLFANWSFESSPLGVVEVTVVNDPRFIANGLALSTPQQNTAARYLTFTPTALELRHDTTYLTAAPVTIAVTELGRPTPVRVDVTPNPAFVGQVQQQVDAYLDGCATQQVLLPTGCPFGQEIRNRVTTPPSWSIITYPIVTIRPDTTTTPWLVPRTAGTARLRVDVQSLFDGTVSTFDEPVPFTVAYTIDFLPNDELLVTPIPEG